MGEGVRGGGGTCGEVEELERKRKGFARLRQSSFSAVCDFNLLCALYVDIISC